MFKKIFVLISVPFLIVSCATIDDGWDVHISKTIFHDNLSQGTIYVSNVDLEKNKLLSFKSYKKEIERYLLNHGYKIVNSPEKSDFIALVSYGTGKKQTVVSVPQFGVTGGGTTTHSGTVGGTSYSGSSYTMPTFGIVGSSSETREYNVRNLAMDIVKTSTINSKEPIIVFEGRLVSNGQCKLNHVMRDLIEGLFRDFPGENGKTQNIVVSDITKKNVDCNAYE